MGKEMGRFVGGGHVQFIAQRLHAALIDAGDLAAIAQPVGGAQERDRQALALGRGPRLVERCLLYTSRCV